MDRVVGGDDVWMMYDDDDGGHSLIVTQNKLPTNDDERFAVEGVEGVLNEGRGADPEERWSVTTQTHRLARFFYTVAVRGGRYPYIR